MAGPESSNLLKIERCRHAGPGGSIFYNKRRCRDPGGGGGGGVEVGGGRGE